MKMVHNRGITSCFSFFLFFLDRWIKMRKYLQVSNVEGEQVCMGNQLWTLYKRSKHFVIFWGNPKTLLTWQDHSPLPVYTIQTIPINVNFTIMHAYSTRTRAVDASKNNKDRETRSRDIEVLLCSYKGQTITGIAAKCISISIERTVKEKRYCRLDRPSKGPFRGLFFSHRFLLSVVRM